MFVLAVITGDFGPNTFEVVRKIIPHIVVFDDSVIKLDYNYTPWPRDNGNLLWP